MHKIGSPSFKRATMRKTENMLCYYLGKRNHEEDSEVVHYDPENYCLMPDYGEYEERDDSSSGSNGYPYFFLRQGNLVDL